MKDYSDRYQLTLNQKICDYNRFLANGMTRDFVHQQERKGTGLSPVVAFAGNLSR